MSIIFDRRASRCRLASAGLAAKPGENVLGEALRRGRLAAGLTQEALAHLAGVDRTYVSMLENGKASPTVETLLRLCAAIGVSAAAVVAEVERKRG